MEVFKIRSTTTKNLTRIPISNVCSFQYIFSFPFVYLYCLLQFAVVCATLKSADFRFVFSDFNAQVRFRTADNVTVFFFIILILLFSNSANFYLLVENVNRWELCLFIIKINSRLFYYFIFILQKNL